MQLVGVPFRQGQKAGQCRVTTSTSYKWETNGPSIGNSHIMNYGTFTDSLAMLIEGQKMAKNGEVW